jgi:hypothetical protein
MNGRAWLVAAALASALVFGVGVSRADTPEQSYAAAFAALAKGADNEAIDRLELLADQGVANPDASLLRAAAYLARADGSNAQAGDLGRAAAALNEVLLLRPDDAQAERALEAVQGEIARRKSKQQESVVVRPRLSRAIAALLPEQAWAMLALLCSLGVAVGVTLRRLAKTPLLRLAGTVAISVGSALMVAFGSGAYAAEQFRVSSQPAVVVVPEARLTNETGRPLPSKRGADTTSVPEGATVYVRERREGRCLVEWGSTDGWLSLSEVRLLAAP